MRIQRVTMITLAVLMALAGSVAAQQFTVRGVRGLSFGTVLPGVPVHTLRTDPVNSGQFELRGPPPKFIVITLSLPTVLDGPAGATMPVSFATNDAGFSQQNIIGSQVAFDPNQSFSTQMGNGRTAVFIGATVSPALGQRAGGYTATLVLSVVVL